MCQWTSLYPHPLQATQEQGQRSISVCTYSGIRSSLNNLFTTHAYKVDFSITHFIPKGEIEALQSNTKDGFFFFPLKKGHNMASASQTDA
jgi:hypothetical protein